MIGLEKLDKPTILENKEELWRNELLKYISDNDSIPSNVNRRYSHKEIKTRLLEETNHKCAYCESKITAIDYGDVEHIKPKSRFPEKTYQWDNLTLACRKCNQNKKDYFDPKKMLINPYIDNPESELMFLGPIISARTERARFTIKMLKLDRAELFESRLNFIKNIQPLIDLYVSEENQLMKELTFMDILSYTKKNSEYSAMMKSVVKSIEDNSFANIS